MDPMTSEHQNDYHELQNEREAYLETWRRTERLFERIGGVTGLFAGPLLFAIAERGEPLVFLTAPGLIAGGLWLIMKRRRTAIQRIHLSYLSAQQQFKRALMFGGGGGLLIYVGVKNDSAVLFMLGLLLLPVAGWYYWRFQKATQYAALVAPSPDPTDTRDKRDDAESDS